MIAAALITLAVAAAPDSHAVGPDSHWKLDKPEHVVYLATSRDGQRYELHTLLTHDIPLDAEYLGTNSPVSLLKMASWCNVPTGADTIRQMVTAFYDARLHRFESLTVLVDSSRGLRFIVAKPKDGKVVWSSTQSGEKRRTLSLNSNREAIFYDALPMWLRGLDLQTPSKDSVAMLPTQLSGQGDNLVPTEIHVIGPAGPPSMTSHGGLEVEVHYAGKVDRFWFHPGPTHMLLAWDKADGTQIAYKGSKRE